MLEEGLDQVYADLVRILEHHELGWIVAQVSEQVRLGKTEKKEVRPFQEAEAPKQRNLPLLTATRPMVSGSKTEFPAMVEYTSKERLLLLIDAIEQAVVVTADIEQRIVEFFLETDDVAPEIRFASEDDDRREFAVSRASAASRTRNAMVLKRWLDELRSEVERVR